MKRRRPRRFTRLGVGSRPVTGPPILRRMIRTQRIVLVALTAVFALSVAVPAFGTVLAQEGEPDPTDTTVAAVPISTGGEPAVVIPPSEIDEAEQPWTARLIIPLLVVTAIVLIIGVVIAYNHTISNRYKVVA